MPTRPVLVVQHTVVCPPGRVGDWLTESGCALEVVRPYAGESLPRGPVRVRGTGGAGWGDGRVRRRDRALAAGDPGAAGRGGGRGRADAGDLPGASAARGGHRRPGGPLSGRSAGRDAAGRVAAGGRRRPAVRRRAGRVRSPPTGTTTSWSSCRRVRSSWPGHRRGSRRCGWARSPGACSSIPRSTSGSSGRGRPPTSAAGQLTPERAETWLAEVASDDAALVATWRPFVHRFAALLPAR